MQWRLDTPPLYEPRKSPKREEIIVVHDAYGRGTSSRDLPLIALPTEDRTMPVKFMSMGWDNPAMESDDYDHPIPGTRSPSLRPGSAISLRRTLDRMSPKVYSSDDDSSVASWSGSARTLTTPHMSATRKMNRSAAELRLTGNVPMVE
jgi:hypothetical protein